MKKILLLLISAVLMLTSCNSPDTDKPGGSQPALTPGELYEKLTQAGLFDGDDSPIMIDIWEDNLSDHFVFPEDAESFIAKEAGISSIFIQLIIIQAKSGKENDVHSAMTEHQSRLTDDAFYPQGQQAAAASIVGISNNIIYLICDIRSAEIEAELLKHL